MKKILFEYANIIGNTVTGLVFGLAFFLIFINFYHAQELSYKVDVSNYNATNKTAILAKINTIKENIGVYKQSTYNGSYNIYGLNAVQNNISNCIEIMESDEVMAYLNMKEIELLDSYNFVITFKNKVLNDCLVMQIKALFLTDTVLELPNSDVIKPYVDFSINSLLDSIGYVQSNVENSDHYYFNTDNNRNNFFSLADDSYYTIMNKYQTSLDLLVEVSKWYKSVVVGG